jgi:formylglycine-generating enzyme required for sulfatase activity
MGAALSGPIDPPHRVVLTQPFCMDATEVTVKAYKACVDAGSCEKPTPWGIWRNYPTHSDHPVNKVDWKHAKAFCEAHGKTLPSEAQWEWAATGGDGRKWPWGNERPTCKHGDLTPGILEGPASDDGCHGGGTSPVATHPDGDRIWPDGRIHDLAGNVWEWVLDNYQPYPGNREVDPVHLRVPDGVHALRGGGWNRSGAGVRTQFRGGAAVDYRVPGVGFRCVRNVASATGDATEPQSASASRR